MIYCIIIIYIAIVIIYFEKSKSKDLNNIGGFIISILVPIFGFIIAIIYNTGKDKVEKITYEFEMEKDENLDDLDNFLLNGKHNNFYSELLSKNYKQARSEIINFNKLSIDQNSKLYIKALNSSDTEISHMAAASLMKIKQQYENDLKLSDNMQMTDFIEYVLKLDEYVRNKLVHGKLKDNLITNCINYAERNIDFKSLNLDYFVAYINLLLEVNKMDLAIKYAYYIKNTWYYSEKAWFLLFNVLLKDKQKDILIKNIDKYRSNNFQMSSEMEEFVAFWERIYEEKE